MTVSAENKVGCHAAQVAPAYGMREAGGFGIRGWRVFCPACGHLSKLYDFHQTAHGAVHVHRRGAA